MRHIIVGIGAVGGVVAARLAASGERVLGIARPAQAAAIREGGLTLETPEGTSTTRFDIAESLQGISPEDGDVIHLAVKTQDTLAVLDQIEAAGFTEAPIVCFQNGVTNEALALRRFAHVYGVCVMLPATYLVPGQIQLYATPTPGILDIGRFPDGSDETASAVAAALERAGFSSRPQTDIMRWKYGKLLMNLGNAIDAAIGPGPAMAALYGRARAEAEGILKAAGIAYASIEEDRARRGDLMTMKPIAGAKRSGGSSWQSLARGTGSIETDYLNGEIVYLARLKGLEAPVNLALQRAAARMARERLAPGSLTERDLEPAAAG